ncbi:GATA zinc finger protein 3 [Lithohypha guttulata]|nr:GATA zinc finger protein 3 [Lithohypha guttulata]
MMASLADHNSSFLQPVCQNCETSTTPLWRRDESGAVLCNACGLFLKLHGRPRPISLKTDVIKSRNRVKTANQGPKKVSLPASQSMDILPNGAHRRVSQMSAQVNPHRSQSPISRTGTPSMHDPNIAPQHLFDGVSLQDHTFQTPALPNLASHTSLGSLSGLNDRELDQPLSYEQLLAQNTVLKTRVSELEVINMMYSDNENNLRRERDEAIKVQEDIRRRLEELEHRIESSELDRPHKRAKLEEKMTTETTQKSAGSGHITPQGDE